MRIVSGKYGSRRLESVPGQGTRPTADKVKGAIFSSLGNQFDGGRFLDCYSGTGNMALEALSRGMDEAVCVDKNIKAIQTIKKNVALLQVEAQCQIIRGDIFSVLDRLSQPFDLIYIDPPYAKQKNALLIEQLRQHQLLKDTSIIVVESDEKDDFPHQIVDFVIWKTKSYRNTKITYYRKEK
ncbi:MAG: 16S rRNA (guanine(966)-N(2))-methyltransferase RsmD [Absicoccus sp.]|uniref:16S rRNA (Guanine(966)-N(2))-methyltransferase RsmD n=1 Tax=Absicoccus intestinalis TaxID=2926319 RepID=A0ABU4WQR8_9FIRM|nr:MULTISPECIES: 16S rRNA (guanine(966)-N(2))-methyltransferase RsmD [unclassified Absicoccus]MDX8417822.1 16S rRNA (guanine(966)-N(2))-methyltransferase RsmD [Absicoccus sp. CLA-KB-P134]MDY3036524.1 16S rRNA (guanine(966)-N(2))-methyltransferase RsmD [Absicoccus sp.]